MLRMESNLEKESLELKGPVSCMLKESNLEKLSNDCGSSEPSLNFLGEELKLYIGVVGTESANAY